MDLGKASTNGKPGLDLIKINVYENFINIFRRVQEIGPVSLFQNLDLGKASADEK